MLGYPQLPATIHDPPPTMHSGEVTSATVTPSDHSTTFLYSAATRPGNSGGPVLFEDGYLVGVASRDLAQERADVQRIAPHYSGASADSVAAVLRAAAEDEAMMPFEPFE